MSMPLTEIVFHGRGGQGAVTAANVLAYAALEAGNQGVQAFPFFGAERRGAPVKAFARISDTEIWVRSQIHEPDIVTVLDTGVMDSVNVTTGLKEDGAIVMNTPRSADDVDLSFRVLPVDATAIAIDHDIVVGGIPIVNTAILGALPHLTENLSIDAVTHAIGQRWSGDAGEANAAAAEQAHQEVQVS